MSKVLFTEFVARGEFEVAVYRLCFGQPVKQICDGTGPRPPGRLRFAPGQVFAAVWHHWGRDRRQHRSLAVVEALNDPVNGVLLPGMSQAVQVHAMLSQHGPAGQDGDVDHFLLLIQAIQHAGIEPTDIPVKYWQTACFQIMLRQWPSLPKTQSSNNGSSREVPRTRASVDHQSCRSGRDGNGFHLGQSPDRDQHVTERPTGPLRAIVGTATRRRDR